MVLTRAVFVLLNAAGNSVIKPGKTGPTPHPSPIILLLGDPDNTRRGPRLSLSRSSSLSSLP